MLTRLRAFLTRLLPWYDEAEAEAEAEHTAKVIQRSIHRRHREEQLLAAAYPLIERRRMPRNQAVRADYQRADQRIGQ